MIVQKFRDIAFVDNFKIRTSYKRYSEKGNNSVNNLNKKVGIPQLDISKIVLRKFVKGTFKGGLLNLLRIAVSFLIALVPLLIFREELVYLITILILSVMSFRKWIRDCTIPVLDPLAVEAMGILIAQTEETVSKFSNWKEDWNNDWKIEASKYLKKLPEIEPTMLRITKKMANALKESNEIFFSEQYNVLVEFHNDLEEQRNEIMSYVINE